MKETSRLLLKIKLIRYLISGVTAAAVHLFLVFSLTDIFGIWYITSAVISFVVSLAVSFSLQKFWTFRDARIHVAPRQMAQYFVFAVVMLVLDAALLYVAVEFLGIWYLLAQIFIFGGIAGISFLVYNHYIFKRTNNDASQAIRRRGITIATGVYSPEIGGPATYVRLLEEHLPSEKYDLRVIPFREVRSLPKILRHLVYFFLVLEAGEGTDIVFAQDPVSVGAPAWLAAKLLRKRFILKVVGDYAWEQHQQKNHESRIMNHGDGSLEEFQDRKYDLVTELRRFVQKFVARNAERVIVPSKYLAGIVRGWGVPEGHVTVIYNAFTPVALEKSKEELRRELGLQGKVITTAGRLVPWKGFDVAIAALGKIAQAIPDTSLVIMGSGPEYSRLQSVAHAANIEKKVRFTQMLPHKEMLAYIKASDVFILPTAYEGFSHLLLEVMAVGTPIITTPLGGNLELIEHEKEGIFMSPTRDAFADATKALLIDSEKREILAQNAQEKAAQFSVERMIKETIEALA